MLSRDRARPGTAPTATLVTVSRTVSCSSHAAFSGASSSDPRYTVLAVTGKATSWSRGYSSLPPPATSGAMTATRTVATATVGSRRLIENRRSSGIASPPATASVMKTGGTSARLITRRRVVASRIIRQRNATRANSGAAASLVRIDVTRGASDRSRRGRRRHRWWPTRPPPGRAPGGRPRRRPAAASSSRWVESTTAVPVSRSSRIRSMVASTPSGSTPSNGSSSSSTSGEWKAASTTESRRPIPCENPAVTRSAAPSRSKRCEQVVRRAASSRGIARSVAASRRCSHGVARGMRPPTSGQ